MSFQRHSPVAFPIKSRSEIPQLQFTPINYIGKSTAKEFVRQMRQVARRINELFPTPVLPVRTAAQQKKWEEATKCFACGEEFVPGDKNLKKVFDHCHYSGKFRSAMYSSCSWQCKDRRTFPVFFHNFSGYDSHFLVKELNAFDDDPVEPLTRNEEKFISIKKSFHIANQYDLSGKASKSLLSLTLKTLSCFYRAIWITCPRV